MSASNGAANEREPLLPAPGGAGGSAYDSIAQDGSGVAGALSAADEELLAQESAFTAIRDAQHGVDPNSSAFAPPAAIDGSTFSIQPAGSAIHSASGVAGEAGAGEQPALRADTLVIMGAMWIGTLTASLESTVVSALLPSVAAEFHAGQNISWIGTSYLLAMTAFQPLYGRCSDIVGRKPATLVASTLFLIGSLWCGIARDFTQLCIARAVAGAGGGGILTMSTIVTSDLIPLRSRGTWQGLGNLVFALGASLGGPVGGLMADGGPGWRWAFLMLVPLCILHFTVVSWKVNIPAGPGSMLEKVKRIDFFGAMTLVPSIALLLLGLSLGGNQRPWSDGLVIDSLVGGLGGLGLFVLVEKYIAREPLLPLRVVFARTPGAVALLCFFTSMSQYTLLFSIPSYFSIVEGTSTSYAGLHLSPNSVFASSTSLASGLIMARTGKYYRLLLVVTTFGWLGPLMMSALWHRGSTSEAVYWLSMPWAGIGYGGSLTIGLIGLIASIEPTDVSAATGAMYLFRATGSILGVSLSQAILQLRLESTLAANGLPRKLVRLIRSDFDVIRTLPRGLRERAVDAFGASLNTVFWFIFATGFLAFVAASAIGEHPLPGSPTAVVAKPSTQAVPREETIQEEEAES